MMEISAGCVIQRSRKLVGGEIQVERGQVVMRRSKGNRPLRVVWRCSDGLLRVSNVGLRYVKLVQEGIA